MARAKRHYVPDQIWHITQRCHKREFLLKFKQDRHRWIQWLFEAKRRFELGELGGTWGRPLVYCSPFSMRRNPSACAICCPLLADWLMVGCDNFNFWDSSMVVIPSSRVAQ